MKCGRRSLLRTLCVLEVVSPQRSDLVLATHVPHRETDVLVFYRLHVEACKKRDKMYATSHPRATNSGNNDYPRTCSHCGISDPVHIKKGADEKRTVNKVF